MFHFKQQQKKKLNICGGEWGVLGGFHMNSVHKKKHRCICGLDDI